MSDTVVFGSRTIGSEFEIDKLVATYSTIGRQRRRNQSHRRRVAAAAIAAALALAWTATRNDLPPRQFAQNDTDELLRLRGLVTKEIDALSAQRAELEIQRRWFETKSRELEAQLGSFESRYAALESQRTELAAQVAQLTEAVAAIDEQRETLLAAQGRGPSLGGAIEAISTERGVLEERWKRFEAEGSQLSSELEVLDRQKRSLEAERQVMDQERRELESLLHQAGISNIPRDLTSSLEEPKQPETGLFSGGSLIMAANTLGGEALGEMRGGIMIGDGMNVTIGLTRVATINGEQQYSSTLQVDNLAAGVDASVLQNINHLTIQNGPGNMIGPQFLGGGTSGLGTIVQNTLDDQHISTATIYDVSIQDVANAMEGLAASQALADSLSFQR